MIAYTIIMLLSAAVFAVVAALIYGGRTGLIHDYHRENVTDSAAYGMAFGKVMGIFAGTMALSGAIALFGERAMWSAVLVLLVGLVAGCVAIVCVQKKYNGKKTEEKNEITF